MLVVQTPAGGYVGPVALRAWARLAASWALHLAWVPGWPSWYRRRRHRAELEERFK